MPSAKALYERHGGTVEGCFRAVIEALSSDLTRKERADYLAYLGGIAHYSEPQFTFEDSGMAYFVAARSLAPDHTMACAYLLELYMEEPDGHKDTALARECYRILKHSQPRFTEDEQTAFDSALHWVQHHGVKIADLE